MTAQDAWSIAGAVIMSLGGGGVIVWFLSNFLDKVWANRIMQEERTIHQQELAKFKEELRTELLIEGQRRIEAHQDKIVIYRGVTDAVVELLSEFERFLAADEDGSGAKDIRHNFNRKRMALYGYLGMLAPQAVMDAQDALVDHLLDLMDGATYDWGTIRSLVIAFINEIRIDLGVDPTPIEYRGKR